MGRERTLLFLVGIFAFSNANTLEISKFSWMTYFKSTIIRGKSLFLSISSISLAILKVVLNENDVQSCKLNQKFLTDLTAHHVLCANESLKQSCKSTNLLIFWLNWFLRPIDPMFLHISQMNLSTNPKRLQSCPTLATPLTATISSMETQ